jgi:DNA excision repair protein ERCC-4
MAAPVMSTIIIDRREQTPWTYSPVVQTMPGTLHGCDYSLVGYEQVIGIERKSATDLLGCLTHDRERWTRSLEALRTRRWHAIVVEGSLSFVLAGAGRSRAHPSSILGSVCAIVADGTPILFADDAWSAGTLAERLLVKFWKRAMAARGAEAA